MILPKFDNTPLESDWDSFGELVKDILMFARTHKDWEVLPADDPGYNHDPPRAPRMGWIAQSPDGEEYKEWTITLAKVRKEYSRKTK